MGRMLAQTPGFVSYHLSRVVTRLNVVPKTEHFEMIAIAFSTIVILGLVSLVMHWAMRIRLLRLDSGRDRIEWLSFRSGDEVLSTYEELFPGSVMPRFCRFVFWAAVVAAAVGLCAILMLKASGR